MNDEDIQQAEEHDKDNAVKIAVDTAILATSSALLIKGSQKAKKEGKKGLFAAYVIGAAMVAIIVILGVAMLIHNVFFPPIIL
jgi:heme/copper-type cytochrome/quinol oxidase subunit 3